MQSLVELLANDQSGSIVKYPLCTHCPQKYIIYNTYIIYKCYLATRIQQHKQVQYCSAITTSKTYAFLCILKKSLKPNKLPVMVRKYEMKKHFTAKQ